MSFRQSVSCLSLCAALAASPAAADLTGPQVWADWKSYMQGFGYDMSGTESQSGDTLTVTDVTMNIELPEDEGSVSIQLSELSFVDNSNGTVTIIMPEEMPMSMDIDPAGGEAFKGTLLYVQDQPTMIASGSEDDLTYTYSAASAGMSFSEFEVDGVVLPPEMFSFSLTMTDLANVTRMTIGDIREYNQNMTISEMAYDMSFDIPEEEDGGTGSISGSLRGMSFSGGGDIPLEGDMEDMGAMIAAGFSVDGGFSYTGGGNTSVDMVTPDGPFVAKTSSGSGEIAVKMGAGGLTYDVSAQDVTVDTIQIPEFPLPVSMALAESGFNLTMPLTPSDEEQEFAFGFVMGDFTISDSIWGLFDPAGQLPRDPATIALDLGGSVTMLADIFDPTFAESGDSPGEINTLSINNILVAAAGAAISGAGGFEFDNEAAPFFGVMPQPVGEVDLRVEGANGLIDTLVAMGLLPDEQAMGARMMMGLFGVPQGDDVLTSKIEINDQGHVLANGQRLQ